MLRIVAATRHDPADFYSQTLLGRALLKFSSGRGTLPVIAHSNARGLPEVFNSALMVGGRPLAPRDTNRRRRAMRAGSRRRAGGTSTDDGGSE